MQEPTHILTGVIIQKSFEGVKNRKLAFGLTAAVAFLSHGFLDKLANLTYHPPQPDFRSIFWVGYHLFVVVATIAFVLLWWKKFKWGILFACLPDLDWVFIHGGDILHKLFHVQIRFYRHPYLHQADGYLWEHIPPLSFVAHGLDRLPSLRHDPLACLFELLLVAILLLVLKFIAMGQRPRLRLEPGN